MIYVCPMNWTGDPAGCEENGYGPHRCVIELTDPIETWHREHLCACGLMLSDFVVRAP